MLEVQVKILQRQDQIWQLAVEKKNSKTEKNGGCVWKRWSFVEANWQADVKGKVAG